jgi:predicted ATP-grasp superfamily ATP-dependent carboligase
MMIAPETGNSLLKAVRRVEDAGCASLNCPSRTLEQFSSKYNTYTALRERGISIPKTFKVRRGAMGEVMDALRSVGYPAIIKPIDGAGCCGLSIIKKKSQIGAAVKKIDRESLARTFLVQEYVDGVHASVSLVCSSVRVKPLSLNGQRLVLSPPNSNSIYLGGTVPLNHPREREVLRETERAVKSLSPLRGYVGVDLILAGRRTVVVDVNPRLTTSYLGLRMVLKGNLAQIIIDASLHSRLPRNIPVAGYSVFSKVQIAQPFNGEVAGRFEEVICPPIRIPPQQKYCALVATAGRTLTEAEAELRQVLGKVFKMGNSLHTHGEYTGLGYRRSKHQGCLHQNRRERCSEPPSCF